MKKIEKMIDELLEKHIKEVEIECHPIYQSFDTVDDLDSFKSDLVAFFAKRGSEC